jgi:hypothetical protein
VLPARGACPYFDASLHGEVTCPVGPLWSDSHPFAKRHASRRSGLYGPTAIFSRSDIFKRWWCTKDVRPEGTDLQKQHTPAVTRHAPVGRAFTVRRPSFREATFSRGGGAPKMSDLKAPTYKYRSPVGRAFTVRQPSLREATFSQGASRSRSQALPSCV